MMIRKCKIFHVFLLIASCLLTTDYGYSQWRDSSTVIIQTPAGKRVKVANFATGDTTFKTGGGIGYKSGSLYFSDGTSWYKLATTVSGGSVGNADSLGGVPASGYVRTTTNQNINGYKSFLDSIIVGVNSSLAGIVRFEGGNTGVGRLTTSLGNQNRTWTLPDQTGTILVNADTTTFRTRSDSLYNRVDLVDIVTTPDYYTARQYMTSLAVDTISPKTTSVIYTTDTLSPKSIVLQNERDQIEFNSYGSNPKWRMWSVTERDTLTDQGFQLAYNLTRASDKNWNRRIVNGQNAFVMNFEGNYNEAMEWNIDVAPKQTDANGLETAGKLKRRFHMNHYNAGTKSGSLNWRFWTQENNIFAVGYDQSLATEDTTKFAFRGTGSTVGMHIANASSSGSAHASLWNSGSEQLIMNMYGSAYTGSVFGLPMTNLAEIRSTKGLRIGTTSTDTLTFGYNNLPVFGMTTAFYPYGDGTRNLGGGSNRWNQAFMKYATLDSITTSSATVSIFPSTATSVNISGANSSVTTIGGGLGSATLRLNGATSNVRDFSFLTNGSNRWIFRVTSTAESGSDAGSDFQLLSRTDAGAGKLTVMNITRAGVFTWGGSSLAWGSQNFTGVGTIASGAITSTGNSLFANARIGSVVSALMDSVVVDSTALETVVGGVEYRAMQTAYAKLYHDTTTAYSIALGTADSFYTIKNWNQSLNIRKNASITDSSIIIRVAGVYQIYYSISSGSSSASTVLKTSIFRNFNRVGGTSAEQKISTANDIGDMSAMGFLYCSAGDYIQIRVRRESGAGSCDIYNAQLVVTRID